MAGGNALGLSFEGVGGSQIPGESPANAPTPAQVSSRSAGSPGGTQPAKSSSPAVATQPNSSSPGANSPSNETQSDKNQRLIVEAIRNRRQDISIPDDIDDDALINEVLEYNQIRGQLPSPQEIESFRKSQPLLNQFQAQLPLFQKWLQERSQENSQQADAEVAPEKTKKADRKKFELNLEPLTFERKPVDPITDMMLKNGMVSFDKEHQLFVPAQGYENHQLARAAAEELTKHHHEESSFFVKLREDPINVIRRAVAQDLMSLKEYVEDVLADTNSQVKEFRDEFSGMTEEQFFRENMADFYETGPNGKPKVDLKTGQFVMNVRGRAYAKARQELIDSGVKDSAKILELALDRADREIEFWQSQFPAGNQQQGSPIPGQEQNQQGQTHGQTEIDTPVNPEDQQKARKRSLLKSAREKAQARGNGATPHNRINHAEPDTSALASGSRDRSPPSMKSIIAQLKAKNS